MRSSSSFLVVSGVRPNCRPFKVRMLCAAATVFGKPLKLVVVTCSVWPTRHEVGTRGLGLAPGGGGLVLVLLFDGQGGSGLVVGMPDFAERWHHDQCAGRRQRFGGVRGQCGQRGASHSGDKDSFHTGHKRSPQLKCKWGTQPHFLRNQQNWW